MSLIQIGVIICTAGMAVMGALMYLTRAYQTPRPAEPDDDAHLSFLFNGDALVHASPASMPLVEEERDAPDWNILRDNVLARFPDFPARPPRERMKTFEIPSGNPDDEAFLRIETFGDHARVELVEITDEERTQTAHELLMLKAQYDRLNRVCEVSPFPMWYTDREGNVCWANEAYRRLSAKIEAPGDPDAASAADAPILSIQPTEDMPRRARASVRLKNSEMPSWFDVTATPKADGIISHATNIDTVIQAEVAQRNFVQTLAKTFAQLSIGLAIFDRNGQLALFNPALVDLSGLPAVFLSTRPDLLTFFDRLRDNRVMPEPKNYSTWRQEITQMISAAVDGTYQETWTLDSGQTYRVSGRPHPDGAVAFLIEDISAEVSLTRNFRAELALGQSLMDTYDEGIVVFSSAGILTFCNKAYRGYWKMDPDQSFADITINDTVKLWSDACRPNPAWGDLRDFVMKIGERATWDAWIERKDGTQIFVTVSSIVSGATVIRFDTRAPLTLEPRPNQDKSKAETSEDPA